MDAILIAGKTGLFSKEALNIVSRSFDVVLTGRRVAGEKKELPENVFRMAADPSDNDFPKAFETRRIRAVWYVTGCTDGGKAEVETERIEMILRLCAANKIPRMFILTEGSDPADYRKLIEKWDHSEDEASSVGIAVVMLPLISGTGSATGRLCRIFTAMRDRRPVMLDGFPDTGISILSMRGLCVLLLRMTSETWFYRGIFSADGCEGRLEDLRSLLLTVYPDAEIHFSTSSGGRKKEERSAGRSAFFRIPSVEGENTDGRLTDMYRFPVSVNWKQEISEQYASYLNEESGRKNTWREKFRSFMGRFGSASATLLDLAVMFAVTQYLAQITSESVYFKVVDVRVLFVVMMGLMHGLWTGMAAAVLECIVLVSRYSQIGISGLLLFYNVENWIPFVYYITAGVICGYTHQKNQQEKNSIMAENELIRNKYLFLNDAYQACVSDCRQLRTQILSEDESYQKLYDAVCAMSRRTPEAVFVEAVRAMRHLLENDSVYIYQMDASDGRARILSCCVEGASRHSLDLEAYPDMARTLREGGTWKNISLLDGAPMYASVVRYSRAMQNRRSGNDLPEIVLIVTLERASGDQLSQSYLNHFMIMCGLLQEALEKASLRERVV